MGTSDDNLLKYEMTLGFRGYYKSSNFQFVYEIQSMHKVGQNLVAVGGKSNEESDSCCIEIFNSQTNSILINLTN